MHAGARGGSDKPWGLAVVPVRGREEPAWWQEEQARRRVPCRRYSCEQTTPSRRLPHRKTPCSEGGSDASCVRSPETCRSCQPQLCARSPEPSRRPSQNRLGRSPGGREVGWGLGKGQAPFCLGEEKNRGWGLADAVPLLSRLVFVSLTVWPLLSDFGQ
jgi:hypothetical protein